MRIDEPVPMVGESENDLIPFANRKLLGYRANQVYDALKGWETDRDGRGHPPIFRNSHPPAFLVKLLTVTGMLR